MNLISSKYQTKDWRKNQDWYINGKHNECEIYQKDIIKAITQEHIEKTNLRFNIYDFTLNKFKNINNLHNGFEYTENIDGFQEFKDKLIYYNLKMIIDSGGAQTRSLREVYHFIKCSLEYLLQNIDKNIYFINILDGDECYRNMSKFSYLVNQEKYEIIKNKIFIGNMLEYFDFYINELSK
jgi:hypothetical protein